MNRYPAYKSSGIEWIGDIPEHWNIATLRRITIEHKQGFYSSDGYVNDGCKLIRISDLDKNGNINYATAPSTNISKEEYEIFSLKKGDFIFPRTGSVGLLGFVQEEIESVFASYLIRFRFKNCNDHFLKYYFLSYSFINGIYADLHGGVNQNIHAENIKNQILPLPPPPEQTAIANFLDRKTAEIDQIIADKEKLIKLYEEEKKALINEAVTKGIEPNVKMKDSGIEWLGEIPEHWEVKKLKYVIKINPSKRQENKRCQGEVVFLPMEKVTENGRYDSEFKRPVNELWNGFTYFEKGDVLIAKITPCFENGKGTHLKELETDFGFGSTEFHVLRAVYIDSAYLFYITRSNLFMQFGEASMIGAAGQKRVPTNFISNLMLGFPSLNEQRTIRIYSIADK